MHFVQRRIVECYIVVCFIVVHCIVVYIMLSACSIYFVLPTCNWKSVKSVKKSSSVRGLTAKVNEMLLYLMVFGIFFTECSIKIL